MEKLVIVKPGCNESANHLLNYLSVYAAGLEQNVSVKNPSFYPYHHFFNLVRHESLLSRALSWLSGWTPALNRLWRIPYAAYARTVGKMHASCATQAWRGLVYLPPTKPFPENTGACSAVYLFGWLYRNPKGLTHYRTALLEAFTPRKRFLEKMQAILAPIRNCKLIGIHIRQEPYKGFPDGEFLISPSRVRVILDEYLVRNHLAPHDVALVIVSDTAVGNAFYTFTKLCFEKKDMTNLFLLSQCELVIGTNSTFPFLSAWFGNIPHIVTTDEEIDWEYYRGKKTYFENKYATFVLGMPASQSVHEPLET